MSNLCERFSFFYHTFKICGYDFGTYITINKLSNLFIMCADIVFSCNTFFGHQGRIGSTAVKDAHISRFFYLVEIGSIDKKSHENLFWELKKVRNHIAPLQPS